MEESRHRRKQGRQGATYASSSWAEFKVFAGVVGVCVVITSAILLFSVGS